MDAAVVDSRGRPCPLPIIDLARAVPDVAVGETVRLLADDPGARVDVPAWCRMRRQELVEVATGDDHDTFRIRRLV